MQYFVPLKLLDVINTVLSPLTKFYRMEVKFLHVTHTVTLVSQEFLFDGSQALAVPLLQVPCHPPAVGELHMAEFTTKQFAIF